MERLADMMGAVDQPTRGEASDCFARIWTRSSRRTEEGYSGNFAKYCLADLLTKPWRGTAQGISGLGQHEMKSAL